MADQVPPGGPTPETSAPNSFAEAIAKSFQTSDPAPQLIGQTPTAPAPEPPAAPVAPAAPSAPAAPTDPATPASTTTPAAPTDPAAPATPAAPESKPELTEVDLNKAESTMAVPAGTAFRFVRSQLKDAQSKIAELEAQVTAAKQNPPEAFEQQIAELKAKVEKYDAEVAVRNVEATDAYQRDVTSPMQTTLRELGALAKHYEIDPNALTEALVAPDPNVRAEKLTELSEGFNRLHRSRFDRLVDDLDRLENVRNTYVTNAQQKLAEIEAERRRQTTDSAIARKAEWSRSIDRVQHQLNEQFPLFDPNASDDPNWKPSIEAIRNRVASLDVGKLGTDDQVSMAFKAEAFPLILKVVADLHEANAQMADKLGKLRSATPSVSATDPTPASNAVPEGAGFLETIMKRLQP